MTGKHGCTRRRFLRTAMASACAGPLASAGTGAASDRPNFVILFTDDQGYYDLSCYGATRIDTPNVDRLAAGGTRFSTFYAQPVCGPSRTALMTGSYPIRADSQCGWNLHPREVTLAEVLSEAGYSTGCIGKWDLSGRRYVPDRIPTSQGFDYYFGTLGANDRGVVRLQRNEERLGPEDDMGKLTGLYTDEAVSFLKRNAENPFFLYLAYTMPHVKLGASAEFRGSSGRGLYGDVIQEIDHSVGRVMRTLHELGVDRNTIVLFTSDNGPWLAFGDRGGLATPLRGGKGSAWEGGFRVPGIMWGPGRIPAGRVATGMASTLDVMPTFARWAGTQPPRDRTIDGRDQRAFFEGGTDRSARDTFFYYLNYRLQAVRRGRWKIFLPAENPGFGYARQGYPFREPELYDLQTDMCEHVNLAEERPEKGREMLEFAEEVRQELGDQDGPGTGCRRWS